MFKKTLAENDMYDALSNISMAIRLDGTELGKIDTGVVYPDNVALEGDSVKIFIKNTKKLIKTFLIKVATWVKALIDKFKSQMLMDDESVKKMNKAFNGKVTDDVLVYVKNNTAAMFSALCYSQYVNTGMLPTNDVDRALEIFDAKLPKNEHNEVYITNISGTTVSLLGVGDMDDPTGSPIQYTLELNDSKNMDRIYNQISELWIIKSDKIINRIERTSKDIEKLADYLYDIQHIKDVSFSQDDLKKERSNTIKIMKARTSSNNVLLKTMSFLYKVSKGMEV